MNSRFTTMLLLVLGAGALCAQGSVFGGGATPQPPNRMQGWEGFMDGALILEVTVTLLFSMLLAAIIAYHPTSRGKAASLEDLEQPRVFILYAMISAVVAIIVNEGSQVMALVIFGIGGLLRFRSVVGGASDTPRVILVTVVGLCCGLQLFVVAVMATCIGWVAILVLESQHALRLLVKGLEPAKLAPAAEAYGEILRVAGCTIVGERKSATKHLISFVLKLPGSLTRDELEQQLSAVPEDYRGAIDWEVL